MGRASIPLRKLPKRKCNSKSVGFYSQAPTIQKLIPQIINSIEIRDLSDLESDSTEHEISYYISKDGVVNIIDEISPKTLGSKRHNFTVCGTEKTIDLTNDCHANRSISKKSLETTIVIDSDDDLICIDDDLPSKNNETVSKATCPPTKKKSSSHDELPSIDESPPGLNCIPLFSVVSSGEFSKSDINSISIPSFYKSLPEISTSHFSNPGKSPCSSPSFRSQSSDVPEISILDSSASKFIPDSKKNESVLHNKITKTPRNSNFSNFKPPRQVFRSMPYNEIEFSRNDKNGPSFVDRCPSTLPDIHDPNVLPVTQNISPSKAVDASSTVFTKHGTLKITSGALSFTNDANRPNIYSKQETVANRVNKAPSFSNDANRPTAASSLKETIANIENSAPSNSDAANVCSKRVSTDLNANEIDRRQLFAAVTSEELQKNMKRLKNRRKRERQKRNKRKKGSQCDQIVTVQQRNSRWDQHVAVKRLTNKPLIIEKRKPNKTTDLNLKIIATLNNGQIVNVGKVAKKEIVTESENLVDPNNRVSSEDSIRLDVGSNVFVPNSFSKNPLLKTVLHGKTTDLKLNIIPTLNNGQTVNAGKGSQCDQIVTVKQRNSRWDQHVAVKRLTNKPLTIEKRQTDSNHNHKSASVSNTNATPYSENPLPKTVLHDKTTDLNLNTTPTLNHGQIVNPNKVAKKEIVTEPGNLVDPNNSASSEDSIRLDVGSNVFVPNSFSFKGKRPIIIDGSNVAFRHGTRLRGQPKFSSRGIEICAQYFVKRGHKVIVFLPSFRRHDHQTLNPEILQRLAVQGLITFTPSQRTKTIRSWMSYDDRFIIQCAVALGGVIVSNDRFRDLCGENPTWKNTIENRVLMFSFVRDELILRQDPLRARGIELDQFLRFPGKTESD